MESEFVSCQAAVQESNWLRRFFESFEFVTHATDAVKIHTDSTSMIAYAKDPKYHGKTKHIDKRCCFIRAALAKKQIVLEYMPTELMIVDPLTKPIPRDVFLSHVRALGLRRW